MVTTRRAEAQAQAQAQEDVQPRASTRSSKRSLSSSQQTPLPPAKRQRAALSAQPRSKSISINLPSTPAGNPGRHTRQSMPALTAPSTQDEAANSSPGGGQDDYVISGVTEMLAKSMPRPARSATPPATAEPVSPDLSAQQAADQQLMSEWGQTDAQSSPAPSDSRMVEASDSDKLAKDGAGAGGDGQVEDTNGDLEGGNQESTLDDDDRVVERNSQRREPSHDNTNRRKEEGAVNNKQHQGNQRPKRTRKAQSSKTSETLDPWSQFLVDIKDMTIPRSEDVSILSEMEPHNIHHWTVLPPKHFKSTVRYLGSTEYLNLSKDWHHADLGVEECDPDQQTGTIAAWLCKLQRLLQHLVSTPANLNPADLQVRLGQQRDFLTMYAWVLDRYFDEIDEGVAALHSSWSDDTDHPKERRTAAWDIERWIIPKLFYLAWSMGQAPTGLDGKTVFTKATMLVLEKIVNWTRDLFQLARTERDRDEELGVDVETRQEFETILDGLCDEVDKASLNISQQSSRSWDHSPSQRRPLSPTQEQQIDRPTVPMPTAPTEVDTSADARPQDQENQQAFEMADELEKAGELVRQRARETRRRSFAMRDQRQSYDEERMKLFYAQFSLAPRAAPTRSETPFIRAAAPMRATATQPPATAPRAPLTAGGGDWSSQDREELRRALEMSYPDMPDIFGALRLELGKSADQIIRMANGLLPEVVAKAQPGLSRRQLAAEVGETLRNWNL